MATPVMGVLVTPGEPAVGPPGHEPTASAAAWTDGIQVSHSKVYQIQVQRDDLEAGRPNTRVIRPLPKQAQFHAVGKRGERYL